MFILIFFFFIFVIIILNLLKTKKLPKELESIPYVSGLPVAWALLLRKPHDEIEGIVRKTSKGYDIYLSTTDTGVTSINITSAEYAKDLLRESEDVVPKLEIHPGTDLYDLFGNGLLFSNGDKWRTHRRLATSAFNNTLSPEIVGDSVLEIFDFMQQKLNRPVDLHEIMQRTAIDILGRLAFGYEANCLVSDEIPYIINVYKTIINIVVSTPRLIFPWIRNLPTENNRKFREALKIFNKFISDIVEVKKNKINNKEISNGERTDLLTSMLKLSEQEGIHTDIKSLRDEMVAFFVAGHDTTAMALSTSFYYLAKYPEIQEKARAEVISILSNELVTPTSDQLKEMKYINAVIKESLRMYPPAAAMSYRITEKSIKIGPYTIPKNVICYINVWQIHYDEKYWKNPKQYNPERFLNNEKVHPYAWIPFSSGPRNCIGQNFSLMEQKVILAMMLLKYNWTLPENSINKDKLLLDSQFLLRPIGLKLVFTERN